MGIPGSQSSGNQIPESDRVKSPSEDISDKIILVECIVKWVVVIGLSLWVGYRLHG